MLTLHDCDTSLKAFQNDIQIGEISQGVFADTQPGPVKAKQLSAVMIEAEKDMYWFARILVLFQLRVLGGNAWTEGYALIQYF